MVLVRRLPVSTVINFGLKKEFLDRYNPADVLKENRLTPEQIAEDAVALI